MAAQTAAAKAKAEAAATLPKVSEEPTAPSKALTIFDRINLISKEAGALAPESKGGVPFAFRGIDGTVAHLTPFLHKYGVFLNPKVRSHIVIPTPSGQRTVKTTEVEVEYEVYGPDGYAFSVVTPGLADDFADRSTAQAMSVAYRLALLQLFHLPTHSKEPEETGQAVLDAPVSAPVQPRAMAQATQAADTVTTLQRQIKAAMAQKGLVGADVNEIGASLTEKAGKPADYNFMMDAGILADVLAVVNSREDKTNG